MKLPTKHFTTADVIRFANSKGTKPKWKPNDLAKIITLEPDQDNPVMTLVKAMESSR
ncbi:MAG: hypothetical protein PHE50_00110 [Dehalococcoidales bacterium]|nr:hypothetical protein [Dehalococcoidales bacterium]